MVKRLIKPLKSDSFFIFGARGTGKSTYIKEQFLNKSTHFEVNLLDSDSEEKYSKDPGILERELLALEKKIEWVFIDEIQKIPKLLDIVHKLIESQKQKFILTGSSARKLKRDGANLLAGRAFMNNLFPLTCTELDLEDPLQVMLWGSLPKVHFSKSIATKKAFLKSYIQTYIKEEIRIEQLVRDLDPFRDFLEVAAQMNGKVINFSKIAKQAGTSDKTVHSYFQILQDTFLGFYLPSFHRSIRKSQSEHPKFYFFDSGVKRQLDRTLGTDLIPSTKAFGDAFEHFLILEIYRRSHYENKDWTFSFFRTKEGNEIDLVISLDRKREILIEIKSTEKLNTVDLNFFKNVATDFKSEKNYVFSMDPTIQKVGLLYCYPWRQGLEDLFKKF